MEAPSRLVVRPLYLYLSNYNSPPRVTHLVLIAIVVYICLIIKSRTRAGSTGDAQMMVIRAMFSEIRLGLNFFREEKKLKIYFSLLCINSY